MSYQVSQATRQAILDNLNATEPKSAGQLATEILRTRNVVQGCIKYMVSRHELEKIGRLHDTKYRALVKTTVSADQVIAEMKERRNEGKPKKPQLSYDCGKKTAPGYYSQKGGQWQPHSFQGGQGAVRMSIGIGSTLA